MNLSATPSVSLSGMNAAALRQYAASRNLAGEILGNPAPFGDPGTRTRLTTVQSAQQNDGVRAELQIAPDLFGGILQDVADQITAEYSFKANIMSLKVADSMLGTALNLRA